MEILGQFSRRTMMAGLGGIAIAGAVNVNAQTLGGASLGTANYTAWRARLGSNFTASTGHVLRLVEVQAYARRGTRPAELRPQGFVARFDVVRGGALPEGLYRVAHPNGGTFEIFLTKGGRDKPLRMLADFN